MEKDKDCGQVRKIVCICGVNYEIIYTVSNVNLLKRNALGLCDVNSRKIFIDGKLSKASKISTLRHEVLHAFFHECGIVDFASNELLIEFLEIQFPKMLNLLLDVGAL